MVKAMTKEDFQSKIDFEYGKGEWYVNDYKGSNKPLIVTHRCGTKKRLSRASSFSSRNSCKKCSNKIGRPSLNLNFKELDSKVKEETYFTYELVKLNNAQSFIVNHKSCDRKPFETSINRFFHRGQRCQCSKRGVVGRKSKNEIGL